MRYRALDADGDMQLTASAPPFLIDSPEAVAQAVLTRLKLIEGEWWLDTTEGTPWFTDILGVRTAPTRDQAVRQRILGTTGVNAILSYSSSVAGRAFTVTARIDTIFGVPDEDLVFTFTPPSQFGQLDFTGPSNAILNTL